MLWKLWLRRYWLIALFVGSLAFTIVEAHMASRHEHEGCCNYEAGAVLGGIISLVTLWFSLPDIIGRYRYAYLEVNDKGERAVKTSSFLDEDRVARALFVARVPHGGWFRRSSRYEIKKPTKRHSIPVLGTANFWSFKAALRFRDGVLWLEREQAVRFLYALPNLSQREDDLPSCEEIVAVVLDLQDERDRLRKENEERGQRVSALLDALTETTRTISDTKRVGKSKEARRIKDEVLLPALDRHLAPDDPRRGEFGIYVGDPAVAALASVPATVS